ncbi:uncharacterized protein [Littorina saxatilis]|uniref:uncharacterized protein n=1 Tax=Littorina saxatilis TaxID=31220 RepID=UPI0038B4F9DE
MRSLRQGPASSSAVIILLCVVTFIVTSHAFDAKDVDNVVRAAQACRSHTNPAVAVAVVKDGRVLLSRGYGVTRLQGNERVTSSTRFNIASLSKAFAATLMLKVMVEDGRYNLSTKVRDILGPDFRYGDDMRTKEATVEDLLSHKMAIPANNRLRFNNNLTRANLKERLEYLHSPDAFRNIYIYSNLMYGLATHMTEVVGNGRWEDLVRRHLFQPLKMKKSTFVKDVNFEDSGIALPVRSYYGNLKRISPRLPPLWSELAGSGAVVSTADDMAKWMNFHLSKGRGPGGETIIAESTMAELYKPRTAMTSSTMTKFRQPDVPVTLSYDVYSMGWRRGYYRGYPIVGHGGSSYGYRSLLTLVPSEKIGVFTTMSGGDSNYVLRGTLHAFLLDHALDVQPWLNVSTLCSFPAPWHNETSDRPTPPYSDKRPLRYNVSAYVGSYENPAYGRVEVREWEDSEDGSDDGREDSAHFTIFFGFGTWDLVQLPEPSSSSPASSSSSSSTSLPSSSKPEKFFGKGRNVTAWVDYSPFVFHPLPAGSDVIVELSVPGFEKRAPPVFTRLGWATSGGGTIAAFSGLLWSLAVFQVVSIVLM